MNKFWFWILNVLLGGEKVLMMGLASIFWAIWKTRNKACFEKKYIKHPEKILYSACAFMRYWAAFYLE